MADTNLIDYIMEGRQHFISDVLKSWVTTCDRFEQFTNYYRDKIRSKIRNVKSDEKLGDIMFELEIPYFMLLDDRFEVEYEKYGTNTRAPDFFISFKQAVGFNLEVKRIRESRLGFHFEKLIQDIASQIQNIPSSFGFSIVVDTLDPDFDIVSKIESSKETVIKYIENTIQNEEGRLPLGEACEYPIPGFEGELILMLSKPLCKANPDETSYNGRFRPAFYTQKEYRKFGDAILEKIGQMIPNMINVLVISSDSTNHENDDLIKSIYSINKLLNQGDENLSIRKGFRGKQDFLNQSKRLSGILFRTNWLGLNAVKERNLLWCNEQADQQIPEQIKEYLRRMNKRALWKGD